MRRKDREIKETDQILDIMSRCEVCRLALNDDGYPYILPLNFGVEAVDGQITLYFHGAAAGTKYELIKKDNRAGFEMDCSLRVVLAEENCECTMEYESVVGRGLVELVPEEEKLHGLKVLMKQYRSGDFPFHEAVVAKTAVMKLTVTELHGKRRPGVKA